MTELRSVLLNRRYVITGGPGFGKSTLIDELEKLGVNCRHEISRTIIKEQLASGGDALPWENLDAVSRIVIEKRLRQLHEVSPEVTTFFDRGIPDVLAYMKHDKLPIPDHITEAAQLAQYNPLVFVTPPWKEIFRSDTERMEDYDKACSLHDMLEKTYASLGYTLVHIPFASVETRASFVLSTIQENEI